MLKKPIVIHLYDDDGNILHEYKLFFLPWRMVKRATTLFNRMSGEVENQDTEIDEMTNFLCEAFKNRFTPDDLADHGDTSEVMQAIGAIVEDIGVKNPNVVAGMSAPQR